MTLQKNSVKLGPLLYLDCVDFGMKDNEIAQKFDATVLELWKEKATWGTYNRKNKLTFKKYFQHKKRNKRELNMLEDYSISPSTLRRKEREWKFMGMLKDETYKNSEETIGAEQSIPEKKQNKISLIEFATLKSLGYSDLEISAELDIPIKALENLKKEWQEIGSLDAVGQVVSEKIKALPLETFKEYAKRAMTLEQIANCVGLQVETVKEYVSTWKNLGLLESVDNSVNIQLQQVKSDYSELRKRYTVAERKIQELSRENERLQKTVEEQKRKTVDVKELERSRLALLTEAEIDAQKIESLDKENRKLAAENERLNARINKEIEKRKKESQAASENSGDHDIIYEKAILKVLKAVAFYGQSDFKYAAKAGLYEIKEILAEVYPYEVDKEAER